MAKSMFVQAHECPECRNESLYLISLKGERTPYLSVLNKHDDPHKWIMDYKHDFKFKCTKCGKEYEIDWRYDVPVPIDWATQAMPKALDELTRG